MLRFRHVIDSIIPFEAHSLDREAVLYHARDKLVVHDVAQHGAVAFNQVLEYLEVCFWLWEAAAVLDGHRLSDDELLQFRVGAIDAFVIDIEGTLLLFIILFLHQTTTKYGWTTQGIGCLSSCSYIKPQLLFIVNLL